METSACWEGRRCFLQACSPVWLDSLSLGRRWRRRWGGRLRRRAMWRLDRFSTSPASPGQCLPASWLAALLLPYQQISKWMRTRLRKLGGFHGNRWLIPCSEEPIQPFLSLPDRPSPTSWSDTGSAWILISNHQRLTSSQLKALLDTTQQQHHCALRPSIAKGVQCAMTTFLCIEQSRV